MLKEHERREYLKSLDQEKREQEEKRLQELKEKHRQHPKVNAPVSSCLCTWTEAEACLPRCLCSQGSVAQLQEVWEETDGLDPLEFNPKTFFKLHGQILPSALVLFWIISTMCFSLFLLQTPMMTKF